MKFTGSITGKPLYVADAVKFDERFTNFECENEEKARDSIKEWLAKQDYAPDAMEYAVVCSELLPTKAGWWVVRHKLSGGVSIVEVEMLERDLERFGRGIKVVPCVQPTRGMGAPYVKDFTIDHEFVKEFTIESVLAMEEGPQMHSGKD